MVLIDTSVWIQFFRGERFRDNVSDLVRNQQAAVHEFVIGELLLGGLSRENEVLLRSIAAAPVLEAREVQQIIRERKWQRFGIGYVDASLAASAFSVGLRIATRDFALKTCCNELGLLYELEPPTEKS